MPHVEVHQAIEAALAADVRELLDAVGQSTGRPALSDHLRLDLAGGGGDGMVAVTARDESGLLIGYAQASRANDGYALELAIPVEAGSSGLVTDALLRAALGAIADRREGPVDWWVDEPDDSHERRAAELGRIATRTLFQMRRSLPTRMPVEIDTRPLVVGDDDEAWLTVNNRAFAEHGEQGGWTVDTLRRRYTEDWFDAEGVRVHDRNGRMAGFCWTKVHPPTGVDPALGEIYVIGVDPDFQGLGLGRQLTLAGLDHLARKGLTTGMLWVDADNHAAVHLYDRLGFAIHSRKTAFTFDPTELR